MMWVPYKIQNQLGFVWLELPLTIIWMHGTVALTWAPDFCSKGSNGSDYSFNLVSVVIS